MMDHNGISVTIDPDRGRMKLYFARRITLRGFFGRKEPFFS